MSRPGEIAKPNRAPWSAACAASSRNSARSSASYGTRQSARCFASSFGAYTYALSPRGARNEIASRRGRCDHGVAVEPLDDAPHGEARDPSGERSVRLATRIRAPFAEASRWLQRRALVRRRDFRMNAPLDAIAQHAQQLRRPHRGRRRRLRGRPAVDHDVRRAQRAREPARARAARRRRTAGRAPRVVRARTRSRCSRRFTRPRKLNLVAVPLSYRFNGEEMAYVIDNSDATTVVVDADEAPLVAEVRGQIPKVRTVVVFGGPAPEGCVRWDDVIAGQPDDRARRSRPGSEAGAAMIYTSGTTGKPKGALRTRTDRHDRVRAARRAEPAARERGAPHHRSAVPLGPARVRVAVAHTSARRSSCCASSTRPVGSIW